MHPKTMRQQNSNHEAPSVRKPSGSQRAQTRASTEYQERFLPPRCHTAVISSSRPKDPYHPLKGTSAEMTTFRSFYVTHKWMKQAPHAPQPSLPPKVPPRCSSAPHNPIRFAANQMAPKVEDYTTVYQNDFQEWKANKRQPFKLADCLKVNQGLVVTNGSKEGRSQKNSVQVADNSKPVPQVQEPTPIESVTSYRSDYVTHPMQPRMRREKPVQQSKGLPLEPAAPLKPKVAWEDNQDFFDEASELFQQFKTWSLENKVHGQAKAKESSPVADNDFLSTTHAHFTAHKCQRTKPILPSTQAREKSKEPLQTTTTMKEDFKAWDTPRRLPSVRKEELDQPKKTAFSLGTPKPAESCKANPKTFSLHPKLNDAAVCSSTCNATKKPQCVAENGAFSGLECIDPGTKEYRMYWNTSVDRGVTWADGGVCEEPPQAHQIISCMVSKLSERPG